MMHSLPEGYRALVFGASGAIGLAFVQALQIDPRCAKVCSVSRQSSPGFDLLDESSMAACAQALAAQGPFHLVLDATGALTVNGRGPSPPRPRRARRRGWPRKMRSWPSWPRLCGPSPPHSPSRP